MIPQLVRIEVENIIVCASQFPFIKETEEFLMPWDMEEKCLAAFWGSLHITGPQLNHSNASGVTKGMKSAIPAMGIYVCKTDLSVFSSHSTLSSS